MSIEPEFLPPQSVSDAEPQAPADPSFTPTVGAVFQPPFRPFRRTHRIPNLGHALLFLVLAGITLFLTEIASYALAMGLHLFGRETAEQMLREPRLLIPSMAVSYLLTLLLAWAIFTNLWQRPFTLGIRWNASIVKHRFYAFAGIGIAVSVAVQLLSNFLPIPKTLPIDDFFRTPGDIWLVAVFGVFLAPILEELAFRGFLFPALASAWDWFRERPGAMPLDLTPENVDPKWSAGALVFSSIITSIGFALLHADQLAHSWAPLCVLFAVSVILCMVRLRAHSLAASTLVHACYNATIFALLFVATDGFRHLDKIT